MMRLLPLILAMTTVASCSTSGFTGGNEKVKSGTNGAGNDATSNQGPGDQGTNGNTNQGGQILNDNAPPGSSNPGGSADNGTQGQVDDRFVVENAEIHIRRKCNVVIAWNNRSGADYLPDIPGLPASVKVTKLNLFASTLKASDLAGVDMFAFSDSPIENPDFRSGYRDLQLSEKALVRAALSSRTSFVFAFDNGDSGDGDASRGSAQLVSALTDLLAINPVWNRKSVQAGVIRPDVGRFPFLKDVEFFFGGGLNTPGEITKVLSPAECVTTVDGICPVAWMPEAGNYGSIFLNGNGGRGSKLYFARLLEKKCQ